MGESLTENSTMELAHVLFMDLVGYSKLPIDRQTQISNKLKQIVLEIPEVKRADAEGALITLFTGDGIALVFFTNIIDPVKCSIEISKQIPKNSEVELRMGIHTGIIEKIIDVNEQVNVAGGGINLAQRVMDCGDGGHILISERVADDLGQYSHWKTCLHDLSEIEVKHGVRLHVYNLFSDKFGNPEPPQKFKTRNRLRFSAVAAGVLAVITISLLGIYYFLMPPQNSGSPALKSEAEFTGIFEQKKNAWVDLALGAQAANGGIKDSPSGTDSSVQVWATAQCLTGILDSGKDLQSSVEKIKGAFEFIESLRRQKPSGGWNLYGDSNPYTVTEINGWVTVAYIKSVDSKTRIWSDSEVEIVLSRILRELEELKLRQDDNGGWRPIRETNAGFSRTYSSTMALWSFLEARRSPKVFAKIGKSYDGVITRGINALLLSYVDGKGWAPNPNRVQMGSFEGLNAQILFVLSLSEKQEPFAYFKKKQAMINAKKGFINRKEIAGWFVEANNSSVPSSDLRFQGTEFVPQGTSFLWFPWTLLTLSNLAADSDLSPEEQAVAKNLRLAVLNHNSAKLESYVETSDLTFILGENLFCVSTYLGTVNAGT